MAQVTYEIVEHNGGWAYRVGDVYSETFASHHEAAQAAEQAAIGHARSGKDEHIEYEDEEGVWHEENAAGNDRPETEVDDD